LSASRDGIRLTLRARLLHGPQELEGAVRLALHHFGLAMEPRGDFGLGRMLCGEPQALASLGHGGDLEDGHTGLGMIGRRQSAERGEGDAVAMRPRLGRVWNRPGENLTQGRDGMRVDGQQAWIGGVGKRWVFYGC
jgi:hypothetical protein